MPKIERASVKARPETARAEPVAMPPIYKPGTASHLKMALFGPPGTGKTTAAVSGSGQKLLILTEPDGDLPLAGRTDVDVVAPKDGKEMYATIQALHSGLAEEYDRVVLDSVTFAFEKVGMSDLRRVLEAGKDPRHTYGMIGASVAQMIHDLVALRQHVIFTTQLKAAFFDESDPDEPGPEEGQFPFTLAVTPMVYKVLSPAVSVRGRTYKSMYVDATGNKKSRFMVSFDDYGRSPAGSRLEGLPSPVENLDVDALIELIERSKNERN